MKLSTIVLTPNGGKQVPFLLIDTMEMKKKSLAYVEYYDCTKAGAKMLADVSVQPEEFAYIPDYAEKPAWYVERRTPYSLIKGGENVSSQELQQMVVTCAKRYFASAKAAETDLQNLAGLKIFQQEMCTLGNPSTDTLTNYDIDYHGNLNLLNEAKAAGVKKFVYISVIKADKAPDVPMLHAKYLLEEELKKSGIYREAYQ